MSLFKIALGSAVLAFCSCSSIGRWLGKVDGRADARRDIEAGRLVLERIGKQSFWEMTHARLLKDRYGIEHRRTAGCIVNDRVLGHAGEYNEIMKAEIARRFGKDVLKKTAQEAQKKTPAPKP